MTAPRPRLALSTAAAVLTALVLAVLAPLRPADAAERYDVTIRRTTGGVPHLLAGDYGSLGFGSGYTLAEDNICTIADSYVTVRAERSRFFGPDETWVFSGNGTVNRNLDSDFFFKRIIDEGVVERMLDDPVQGPRAEIREGVRGYVDGYNHYLRTVGVANLPDPACRGADWVREISEIDAYRRFYQLALLASSGVAINEIGSAQPPTPPLPQSEPESQAVDPRLVEELRRRLDETLGGIGSNAYGFGRDLTSNGRGMVLGNPHFPWQGAERLYQSHLTIPGRLNVAGSSLYGVPLVLIGTTEGVAWSHTVSTARRFTIFELALVPGSPTTYLVDGQPREMTRTTHTVEVRLDDGTIEERTRTLYATHHGPVLNGILALPIFPWTPARAFAIGDANAANFRYLNHFFEKNHAQSVDELFEIQKRNLGIPWVNTLAADKEGKAYYADVSVVPHVTDAQAQSCSTLIGQSLLAAARVHVLDAARSDCEWGSDPDSPQPGTFGPGNLPHLFRFDYTSNGNDSHWLTNPSEPLEGFPFIVGDERTQRTLRTRLGIVMAEEVKAAAAAGDRFDVAGLRDLVFNNRQHAGELTRDAVVAMCESFPGGQAPTQSGGLVDVSAACPALATWNLRDDLDSTGALVFRRFWVHAQGATGLWQTPFDPADPVHTPRDLNTAHPLVREALGRAVSDLDGAGIPADAPLGQFQYSERGERIPIHGGPGVLGVFNALNAAWNPAEGYSSIPHGSSFVMATQFTDGPCPDAWAVTTYSQSDNAASPFYNDQTKRYSDKQWLPMRLCESEVLADPNLVVQHLSVTVPGAPAAQDPVGEVAQPAVATGLPATGGGLAALGLAVLGLAAALAASGRGRRTPPGGERGR